MPTSTNEVTQQAARQPQPSAQAPTSNAIPQDTVTLKSTGDLALEIQITTASNCHSCFEDCTHGGTAGLPILHLFFPDFAIAVRVPCRKWVKGYLLRTPSHVYSYWNVVLDRYRQKRRRFDLKIR